MADIGERFGGDSASGAAITCKNGGLLGRCEGLGLSARVKGSAGQVCGGGRDCCGKVDFRLASAKG